MAEKGRQYTPSYSVEPWTCASKRATASDVSAVVTSVLGEMSKTVISITKRRDACHLPEPCLGRRCPWNVNRLARSGWFGRVRVGGSDGHN